MILNLLNVSVCDKTTKVDAISVIYTILLLE